MSGEPTANKNSVTFNCPEAEAAAREVLGSLPPRCLTDAPRHEHRTALGALLVTVGRPPRPGRDYLPVSAAEIHRIYLRTLELRMERNAEEREASAELLETLRADDAARRLGAGDHAP